MTIQAVSFGKEIQTPKGNKYKKTHAATIAGTVAGAATSSLVLHKVIKNNTPMIKRVLGELYVTLKETMPKAQAKSITKFSIKGGAGVLIAGATLIGLGAGAIVNKVINNNKAKNADKPVMLKEEK